MPGWVWVVYILFGLIASGIFVGLYRDDYWDDFEVFWVAALVFMLWPVLLAVALVLGILAGPVLGVAWITRNLLDYRRDKQRGARIKFIK